MTAATITPKTTGLLSPAQQDQVVEANGRAKKIRKAATVAKFNGWTIGILAVCSAPFALLSFPGLLITTGMSLVAYNEFKGRRRLLHFDGDAAAFLGRNQVGFLVLIIFYSLWMLSVGLQSESPFAAELKANPELSAVLGSESNFDQYYRMLVVAFYGSAIVLSVVFQGLNAIYYFTRQKHVKAYLKTTPDWVLDLQRLSFTAS